MSNQSILCSWRLWLILSLALGLRLLPVRTGIVLADLALVGDEGNYVFNGAAILDGTLAEQDLVLPWMRAPLLPLAIAGLARLSGTHPLITIVPIILFQILISVAMVGLVAGIAARLLNQRAGLLAALGLALLPTWIYYPQLVLSETLYSFLLLCAVALLAYRVPGEAFRPGFWLALGGVLGLAALSRSAIISAVPLFWLACWLLYRRWRPVLLGSALLVVALGAVLAPWTIRNYRTHGGIILVDTTGPYTLWQDNTTMDRPEVKAIVLSYPGPAERQAFASAAFRQEVSRDPGRFLRNAGQRLLRAPLPEPAHGYRDDWLRTYPDRAPRWADWYALGSTLSYALLLPLALYGALRLWRAGSWRSPQRSFVLLGAGLTAQYAVQTMTTHFSQRFLIPLFPVYVVLAAIALAAGWRAWRQDATTWGGRAVALVAVVFWIASASYNQPALRIIQANWYWWRGAACASAADLAELEQASLVAPRNTWHLTTDLGRCQIALGQPQQGLATLQQALTQAETQEQPGANVHAALVHAYRTLGDLEQAQAAQSIATTGRLALLDWAWRDLPPPTTVIAVGQLDVGYLRGFYGAEQVEGRSYRWMGSRGDLRFPGCRPGLHMLQLSLASGHPEGSAARLQINAGRPISLRHDWHSLSVLTSLGEDCTVTLRASTWQPLRIRPESRDPRSLGLSLQQARLIPLLP